jgi:hypothetical protein
MPKNGLTIFVFSKKCEKKCGGEEYDANIIAAFQVWEISSVFHFRNRKIFQKNVREGESEWVKIMWDQRRTQDNT